MADGKEEPLQATRVAGDAPAADVAAVAAAVTPESAPVVADVPAAGAAAGDVVDVKPVAAAPEAKPELTTDKPSLLDSFEKKEEPKAEAKADAKPSAKAEGDKPKAESDKPKAEGDKPAATDVKPAAEAGKAAEPAKDAAPAAPEPVAYEYTVPETLTLDDVTRGELHSALDAFRADPAKGAQALIDLHNKAVTSFAEQTLANQHKAFNETRSGWARDVLADEEIGGAGHQTAMRAIARMRDLFVPEKERAAFDQFLRVTGAGDHPQFLKLLHQAARYIDEPSMPPVNAKPTANNGKPPGRRRDAIYDHPSSQKQRS